MNFLFGPLASWRWHKDRAGSLDEGTSAWCLIWYVQIKNWSCVYFTTSSGCRHAVFFVCNTHKVELDFSWVHKIFSECAEHMSIYFGWWIKDCSKHFRFFSVVLFLYLDSYITCIFFCICLQMKKGRPKRGKSKKRQLANLTKGRNRERTTKIQKVVVENPEEGMC